MADELYAELRKIGEKPWWLERGYIGIKNLIALFISSIKKIKLNM